MSDAAIALVAGLGGAIIGASAALGAQWLAIRSDRKAERRRETVELVSRFWDVSERLLNAAIEVDVEHRQLSKGDPTDRLDWLLSDRENIDVEGRFLAAQMRLLRLPVAEHAQQVLKTTRYYHGTRPGEAEARADAIRDYETSAANLLDSLN